MTNHVYDGHDIVVSRNFVSALPPLEDWHNYVGAINGSLGKVASSSVHAHFLEGISEKYGGEHSTCASMILSIVVVYSTDLERISKALTALCLTTWVVVSCMDYQA